MKGAFLNYLDNAYRVSLVEEDASNLLRRGRSLETKQERTLDGLTLLPWTKGAEQEKRLFEYQLGVSGFIFMGLMSNQYQFAMQRFLYWSHPSKHHLSDGYAFTHLAYDSELIFNPGLPCLPCSHPPCLFRAQSIFNPGLPCLHFTRSSILVLSASAALSILCLRIKPQSAQDLIPIHISQSE